MPARGPRPRPYLVVGGVLVVGYVVVALSLPRVVPIDEDGPLSWHQRDEADVAAVDGPLTEAEALDACYPPPRRETSEYVVVPGRLDDGRLLYACYRVFADSPADVRVVEPEGVQITDASVLIAAGAWRWAGVVKTPGELVLGGFAMVAFLLFGWQYFRRPRPGPASRSSWWQRPSVTSLLALLPVVGWFALAVLPGLGGPRRRRVLLQVVWLWVAIVVGFLGLLVLVQGDPWGRPVLGLLGAALLFAGVGGRALIAPPGFDAPADAPATGTPVPAVAPDPGPASDPAAAPDGGAVAERAGTDAGSSGGAPPAPGAPPSPGAPAEPAQGGGPFTVHAPSSLPTFADVGGMDAVKEELSETFGLMLAFAGEAEQYRITWNGLLLHGPPGVGKSHLARAVAGEFGMSLLHVSTGDLVSAYRGESSRNVEEAFRQAVRRIPCVLFFDEFDSVAQRREDWPDPEARRTVNQLLQSLEGYRRVREQIVIAATNALSDLDPAVVRPGRFDRHVRVDVPDEAARAAIVAAQLRDRPAADVDVEEVARRSQGLTPAALSQVVERAALDAFREAAASGELVHVTTDHLLTALQARGGTDRPMVEHWTWDRLVLPADTKAELRQLQRLVEQPETARALGVEPPTGVLLTGPPGTGKTTISRVLAAEAKCSFYPVSAADVRSKWVGESERNVKRLFERARENRPSIVFIDEIDAIAGHRGGFGSNEALVNELLAAMDGMSGRTGILVVGATNRPDQLDPAIRRGGRLSRTIDIPAPDRAERRALLELFTERMPTVGVDLDALADATDGLAGADLEALCQQAALLALVRTDHVEDGEVTAVIHDDFVRAHEDLVAGRTPTGASTRE